MIIEISTGFAIIGFNGNKIHEKEHDRFLFYIKIPIIADAAHLLIQGQRYDEPLASENTCACKTTVLCGPQREKTSRLEVDCTVALRIKVTSRWNRFPAGPYSRKERIRLSHTYESARMSVINGNGYSQLRDS